MVAVFHPQLMLLISGASASYVAVRFVIAGAANLRGLRLMRSWQQINWWDYYACHFTQDAMPWQEVRHVVIIPNYREPLNLLRATLDHLVRVECAAELTIVLAMEAAERDSVQKAACLQREYAACFGRFFVTVHPSGLPGEIQCKSANLAWATQWVKRKLVDEIGLPIDRIVVTTMDADARWHPAYFSALTALFALDPQRHARVWQAPPKYQDNIESLPPVMRLVHDYSSAIELAHLAAPWWWGLPISSYSLSLQLVERAGYWDADVIADEWHMFIKSFFASQAQLRVCPIFLPFHMRVTAGSTLWDAVRNRYLQTLRHAWGSKEITYVIREAADHPHIPLPLIVRLLARVAHDVVMSGFGWLLVTFGALIPLVLYPSLLYEFVAKPLQVPGLLLLMLSTGLIFVQGAVHAVLQGRLRDHRSMAQNTVESEQMTRLSFVLLPVLMFIFVTLPVLHAQTLLLFGRSLNFRVTRKQ